jgi:putative ABC transport system permease protein
MALPLVYHWRSLFTRKTTTSLTMLVISTVVGVLTWMLGFASALDRSLATAHDEGKLIVLRRGATAESNSAIPIADYNRLKQLTALARDPQTNEPLVSPEVMVQVWRPRLRDGGRTAGNVAVRGVTDVAFKVHRNVKLLGKSFSPAQPELIVGVAAARQFGGLNVGQMINLGYGGNRSYTIVGHFTADGSPLESEVWGYLPSLMNSYNRTMYSSSALRIQDGAEPDRVIEQIEGPAIQLAAWTETEYWAAQATTVRTYLMIAYVLAAVMSLAAVFSIANTMFSFVAGRTQEIAMLRTIGFSGNQVIRGFLVEAVLISLLGGALGCLACAGWLGFAGNTKDMMGSTTFTTMAFEIHVTARTILLALLAVMVVGMAGALIPAVRAARIQVISALREA